ARLGDVGEQLQGVADVLAGAFGGAAFGLGAALDAGAPLFHDDRHDAATVGGRAAIGGEPAIGVRQLHAWQFGTGRRLQLAIPWGGWGTGGWGGAVSSGSRPP